MRFSELLALCPSNKLVNINNSVYEQLVDRWAREMGAVRLFGYRRETRIEHFQEAVDTVYTALEGELQTADPGKIMSHPKWTILVGCAKRNFPDHLSVYQPSPLEQTRVKRMVRNTLVTQIIANKIDLLDIIKQDKTDAPGNIGEVAVSRLRYELLAASAARVHDRYMKELDSDWRTWYEWQQKTAGMYHRSTSTTTADSSVTGFGSGIKGLAKGSAEASVGFTSKANAGLTRNTRDKEWQRGGFQKNLKGNMASIVAASGSASGSARMAELMASADAGLEAEASLRADIDYEMTYSCKVKGEYLRRLLGGEVNLLKVSASGSAAATSKTTGSGGASARMLQSEEDSTVEFDFTSDRVNKSPLVQGIKASLEGEVALAVVMQGRASVAIGQAAEVELGGDLFAGAIASGKLKCFINGQGVGLDIGGKLFAGFELGTEQKISLTHPGRGISIFALKARESLSVGVGMAGKLAARATIGEVSFDAEAGATLGLGSSIKASGIISPRGLMLVGYDAIALPAIDHLSKSMSYYYPSSVHTDRLVTFAQYLNRRAYIAELSQVYLDCRGRMVSLVDNLDREADAVQKRAARIPGFNGYGDVMGIDEINAVDGFVGNSQSKYFQYANDDIKLDDGTVLQSQTVKGDRKDQLVADDKSALLKAAQDYAGQKKITRTGTCIAFEVIKNDIRSGQLAYA